VRLSSLESNSSDPQLVASKWKYSDEGGGEYIASCVLHAPSSCLRDGEKMVAWIGLHWDLSLGYFWVEAPFRHRGLGKLLAAHQVEKTFDYVRPYLDEAQVGAYFFTESSNEASKALFQNLCFSVVSEANWLLFGRENHSPRQEIPQQHVAEKVNLGEKLALFADHWHPRIIAEVDDFDVKVAKLKGEFFWHSHDSEDELFLITKGRLLIKIRENGVERDINLSEGELFVVPKGVEHKPIAEEECSIVLLEKRGLVNTGNIRNERTRENLERI